MSESLETIRQTVELFIDTEGGFIAVGRYDGTIYTYNNGTWSDSTELPPTTQLSTETPLPNMIIHDISSGGLSFQFENTTDKEYLYSSHYTLYVNKNNVWELAEPIIDWEWVFTDEGYILFPNSTTDLIVIDWIGNLGELTDGEYKFQKEILFSRRPGDFDRHILEYEFTIQ